MQEYLICVRVPSPAVSANYVQMELRLMAYLNSDESLRTILTDPFQDCPIQ